MFIPSVLKHRDQFGAWLNFLGLTGTAAEIGTHRGVFADRLLREWSGQLLHCVDPWSDPWMQEVDAQGKLRPVRSDREADYMEARLLRDKFPGRVILHRMTSERAATSRISNKSLDFVYLDGDHNLEPFRNDLRWWWPKLKPGGVMAGHDVRMPPYPNNGWGRFIQPAIQEFIDELCQKSGSVVPVHLVPDPDSWSFHFTKRECDV